MKSLEQKLDLLRERLLAGRNHDGALLVVYDPADELAFRQGYREVIQEARAREVQLAEVEFRTLPFDVLLQQRLLEKGFTLDAEGSRDAHQSLARMVQDGARLAIGAASSQNPDAAICCHSTASLFPWISYSSLLESIESVVRNTVVLPFPGKEDGAALHFLSIKDGYNYRAARI